MSDLKRRWFTSRRVVCLFLLLFSDLLHAGTHHYYYTDPQGTVLAKTDANGTIIATYDYTPYGTAVASMSPAPMGPGYTGHVNDPDTGLVYTQARYYDPTTGGFLSVDPVTPATGNIFNFSRYAYANNNPIANTDPDGRCPDKSGCNEAIPYSIFRDTLLGRVVSNVIGNKAALFSPTSTNPLSGNVLDRGQLQDAKLGVATDVLSAIVAPELLPGKSAGDGAAREVGLTAVQLKNVDRFTKKLPANAKDSVSLKALPNDGVATQAASPGRVPGSSAIYEKQIDSAGKTI